MQHDQDPTDTQTTAFEGSRGHSYVTGGGLVTVLLVLILLAILL